MPSASQAWITSILSIDCSLATSIAVGNTLRHQGHFGSLINKNFPEEDVILIDQDAWNLFLTKKEQDEIEKHLNSNSKILYLV